MLLVVCRQSDTFTIARMLVGRPVLEALGAIPFLRVSIRWPSSGSRPACARAGSGGAR